LVQPNSLPQGQSRGRCLWLFRYKRTHDPFIALSFAAAATHVALSVLTGVAALANAFDATSFYEQLERSAR
jgi:hypothetical protein